MGMPSLLRKIFLVDLLQGLKVTFRYQDPREIYTEQYPLERPQVAERYRGAPRLNVNPDTDETMHCLRSVRPGVSRAPDRGFQRAQ
jgi:NADH-quinone oxidoreductase subunit I